MARPGGVRMRLDFMLPLTLDGTCPGCGITISEFSGGKFTTTTEAWAAVEGKAKTSPVVVSTPVETKRIPADVVDKIAQAIQDKRTKETTHTEPLKRSEVERERLKWSSPAVAALPIAPTVVAAITKEQQVSVLDPQYICCELGSWACEECGTPTYLVYFVPSDGLSYERHTICGSGKHKKCTMDLGPSSALYESRKTRPYVSGECQHLFCKAPENVSLIKNPSKDGKTYAELQAVPYRQRPGGHLLYNMKRYEFIQLHGVACNLKGLEHSTIKNEAKKSPKQCHVCGLIHEIIPWDSIGKVMVVHDNGHGTSQLASIDRIDNYGSGPAMIYLVYANQSGRGNSYISRYLCEITVATAEQALEYQRDRDAYRAKLKAKASPSPAVPAESKATQERAPLQNEDPMVWCQVHRSHTNMDYMGGRYLDRSDAKRTPEELAKCVCCHGRHRSSDYLDRVNRTQEEHEKVYDIPKDKWVRVSYSTAPRNNLNEPYPRVQVGPPPVVVSSLSPTSSVKCA